MENAKSQHEPLQIPSQNTPRHRDEQSVIQYREPLLRGDAIVVTLLENLFPNWNNRATHLESKDHYSSTKEP
jgi:hypothetical protein